MSRIGDKLGRVEPVESGAVIGVPPSILTDPETQLKSSHKMEAAANKSEEKETVGQLSF